MAERALFPHSVLLQPLRIRYADLDTERVRRAPFADFRLKIPDEDLADHPLAEEALEAIPEQAHRFRFLIHTAFCGSTLVAGLLDRPGRVVAVREPQGLRDLSEIKAYYVDWMSIAQLQGTLNAYLSAMARWAANEGTVLLKPSNLSNGLAPDLLAVSDRVKALLLSCSLRDYLLACLGKDRRLLQLITHEVGHWHRNFPHRRRYRVDTGRLNQNPLYGPAVLWHLQRLHLARLRADFPDTASPILDFADFRSDPGAFMDAAAGHLGLPLDRAAVSRGSGTHAKTGEPYSPAREDERRARLADEFGELLSETEAAVRPLLKDFPVPEDPALPAAG